MKKLLSIFALLAFIISFSQNIILSKVEKTSDSKDKIFYKINPEVTKGDYLGEILVNGFNNDDVTVFDAIYKKAKEIGANTFSLKKIEGLEEEPFNPNHYFLDLYYVPSSDIPQEYNTLYIVASADKTQKLSINNQKVDLLERHFIKKTFSPGETVNISTRQFLGSSIKVTGKDKHPAQYFQISNFKIKDNQSIYGGINIKSSDIIGLEKSFADFLTTIYQEQK